MWQNPGKLMVLCELLYGRNVFRVYEDPIQFQVLQECDDHRATEEECLRRLWESAVNFNLCMGDPGTGAGEGVGNWRYLFGTIG